jgi:HEAT repeat protein
MDVPLRIRLAFAVLSVLLATSAVDAEGAGRDRIASVRGWLAALREPVEQPSNEPAAWIAAYEGLRAIGPDDRVLLPELTAALDDPIPRVRAIAAEALGNIGPEARAAVRKLRQLLPKRGEEGAIDEEVVTPVATALGQIGDEAVDADDDDGADAADGLVCCFRGDTYSRAQDSLLRMGRAAVPAIVVGLKSRQPNIREGCLSLLARMNCPELLDPDPQLNLLGDQAESFHHTGCMGWSVRVGHAATDSLVKFGLPIEPRLRKVLESPDPVVRLRAASILVRLRISDQPVIDRLVDGLRTPDAANEALEVIHETKRTADHAVLLRLRRLLQDANADIRSRAAVALTDFGAVDLDVLRVQIQRLSNPHFADEAADSLGRFQGSLKPLEQDLINAASRRASLQARWLAAGLLARVQPEHPAVAANLEDLRKRLGASDNRERRFAFQAALLMGEKGWPTVFEFLKRDEHIGYGLPPECVEKAVARELLQASKEPGANSRYVSRLIEVAGRNPVAETLLPCVPILIAHLPQSPEFPNDWSHEAAATALVTCGKRAVPGLIRALKDPNASDELRCAVIECLGKMGSDAQEALPVLASEDLFKQLNGRWELVQAIKKIGATVECLPVLLASLEDFLGSDDARDAILTLGDRVRSDAVKMLESEHLTRRKMGRDLLLSLGPKAEAEIPAVIRILHLGCGNDVDLLQILASLGPAAKAATPLVLEHLKSEHVRIRSAACVTLARIADPDAKTQSSVITPLIAATHDNFAEVRAASADALGLIAPESATARSAIERLRYDRFATVRHAAQRATSALADHQAPPAKIWTIYFDPAGPAAGLLLANESPIESPESCSE